MSSIQRTIAGAAVGLSVLATALASQAQNAPFVLQEASIESIHAAFNAKSLTCAALVQSYLDRIDAYDKKGPTLRALITVNPAALTTARELDERYTQKNGVVDSLHCIPLILKDNFNTHDMPRSCWA